jgi:prepilin peptidase CpaA
MANASVTPYELLAALATDPCTGVLLLLLVAAAIIDWRSLRIPNWLTFSGMALGLACNAIWPSPPHAGLLNALGGLALGFAVMLPIYAFRLTGAGDVKLMAMTGSFLGLWGTLHAILFTFVAAGLVALLFAWSKRSLGRMLGNVRDAAQALLFSAMATGRPVARIDPSASAASLPYAVSIGIGTAAYLVAKQLGYA